MKKVLVVDWLDKYGGAERVITSLFNVFEFEKCYTLINVMKSDDILKLSNNNVVIEETWLSVFGNKFRGLVFIFPWLINNLHISHEVDLIISSSHAVSKGVRKSNNKQQFHVCYFQARNLKYIWSDTKLYFGAFRYLLYPIFYLMRQKDVKDAQLPDCIIANSKFVKKWIKDTYNRDSIVIYPPVDLSKFSLFSKKENYYVAVGRIEPYKRFDIIIEAFNQMPNKKIRIIGDGSQLKVLKTKANSNIEFLGFLESQEVFNNIKKAKGFIHAGVEDFGIAPIEAQACGTPVIAYGYGGVLETIIPNKTGVFFNNNVSSSLIKAIIDFERLMFDYKYIRTNALRFSTERFEREIEQFINERYTSFKKSI